MQLDIKFVQHNWVPLTAHYCVAAHGLRTTGRSNNKRVMENELHNRTIDSFSFMLISSRFFFAGVSPSWQPGSFHPLSQFRCLPQNGQPGEQQRKPVFVARQKFQCDLAEIGTIWDCSVNRPTFEIYILTFPFFSV